MVCLIDINLIKGLLLQDTALGEGENRRKNKSLEGVTKSIKASEHESRAGGSVLFECTPDPGSVSKMVLMLFLFFLLLLLCSSLPGPRLEQMNPSPADSPGSVSKVKRRPAALNRCTARAFPPDRSAHLAADQKLMAKASLLLSPHPSFFLHLPACERLLRYLQSIPRGPLCLGWLAAVTNTHTHTGTTNARRCRHV